MAVVAIIGLARGRLADARGAAWASIALAPAFVAQGALGGWVVRSGLDPAVVTIHFAVAFLVLGLVVAIAVATGSPANVPRERPEGLARVAAWSAALVYALLMVGTYVRAEGAGLAFRDWPLMAGRLVPSLAPDGALAMFTHRALAVLATAVEIWVAVRVRTTASTSARTRRFATWSVVAILTQIALGALNVLTELAAAPRAAHVGVRPALGERGRPRGRRAPRRPLRRPSPRRRLRRRPSPPRSTTA